MAAPFILANSGDSVTVNGAIFNLDTANPTGTGAINSFLRIHDTGQTANGIEQGYNAGNPPTFPTGFPDFDQLTGNFTRDITLGQIPIVNVASVDYREFLLDLGEPGNNPTNPPTDPEALNLTALKIFVDPTAITTASNDFSDGGAFGDLVYDLGPNNVLINDLSAGNGGYDVIILIPDSLFAGKGAAEFVTLYAEFQADSNGEGAPKGTFEEFAIRTVNGTSNGGTNGMPIPEPSSVLMWLVAGLGILGYRHFQKKSLPSRIRG